MLYAVYPRHPQSFAPSDSFQLQTVRSHVSRCSGSGHRTYCKMTRNKALGRPRLLPWEERRWVGRLDERHNLNTKGHAKILLSSRVFERLRRRSSQVPISIPTLGLVDEQHERHLCPAPPHSLSPCLFLKFQEKTSLSMRPFTSGSPFAPIRDHVNPRLPRPE